MTILRGPADADHFRVQVGRYGERWYADPLSGDTHAPATDASWPSVSTIKKGASGSDWSYVALKRVADALELNPNVLAGLDHDECYDKLKSINNLGLKRAAARGTNVHTWFERLLRGEHVGTPMPGEAGAEYLPAIRSFFDQYQPELVAAELVCINRGLNNVGYGGTGDAIIRIAGQSYFVDWKSRGTDSKHGAYPEEAAQVAAYATADYIIAEGDNGPVRSAVPRVDAILIVSIKPDGCRVYPVDLGLATAHWVWMHSWWKARRSEREAIGKPWAPRKTAPMVQPEVKPATDDDFTRANGEPCSSDSGIAGSAAEVGTTIGQSTEATGQSSAPTREHSSSVAIAASSIGSRRVQILTRLQALPSRQQALVKQAWPSGVPSMKGSGVLTSDELDAIEAVIEKCGRTALDVATTVPIDSSSSAPDEGPLVPDEDAAALRQAFLTATPAEKAWILATGKQCNAAGYPVNLDLGATRRRWAIDTAMVHVARLDPDDYVVRAMLETVIDEPVQPAVTIGAAFAALTIAEAEALTRVADGLADGAVAIRVAEDGEITIGVAA